MEMKDKVWQGELLGHKNIGYKRLFEGTLTEIYLRLSTAK